MSNACLAGAALFCPMSAADFPYNPHVLSCVLELGVPSGWLRTMISRWRWVMRSLERSPSFH